ELASGNLAAQPGGAATGGGPPGLLRSGECPRRHPDPRVLLSDSDRSGELARALDRLTSEVVMTFPVGHLPAGDDGWVPQSAGAGAGPSPTVVLRQLEGLLQATRDLCTGQACLLLWLGDALPWLPPRAVLEALDPPLPDCCERQLWNAAREL